MALADKLAEKLGITRDEAEARIVELLQAVASEEPIAFNDEDMYHWCSVCQADLPIKLEDHKEDCSWRKAVETLRDAGYPLS